MLKKIQPPAVSSLVWNAFFFNWRNKLYLSIRLLALVELEGL